MMTTAALIPNLCIHKYREKRIFGGVLREITE